ncbi:hypothetical protein GALMADRAFT_117099 [Galerina marginata CBS 339.88]|uniref:F-box domain-containing protein n=1 Tax=Galerina marginata (strain CBS 339.88) TaxID=685588 RepID=A0A067TDE3_GALM3|nr:hypothetical protein GALMADRAFT_117099 [Galerina marginata CBS 339.88]
MLPCFDGATQDVALSLFSYNPRDIQESVLTIALDDAPPDVGSYGNNTRPSPGTITVGGLDALPNEVFEEVLRYADLRSVCILRSVTRHVRRIIDASSPYKHITRHAPGLITAFRRTRVASHFSVDQVFRVLCTPSCHVCGEFGSFLWIPECIRCCFLCLREAPELMPMTEVDAKAAFGLTKTGLAKVPVMVTLPGNYTVSGTTVKKRRHLVSREKARQVAIVVHEAFDSKGRLNITVDHITRFMSMVVLPYFDPSSQATHVGLACRGCQFALENAPEVSSHEFDKLAHQRDRMYTEDGIVKHFEVCSGAHTLWRRYRKTGQPSLEGDE